MPLIDLSTLDGTGSQARGINDHSQIVGSSFTADGYDHAFLWHNGVMTDLGILGTPPIRDEFSIAFGINNRGQVVGSSSNYDGCEHAFLWQNGVMTDLGVLEPSPFSGEYSEA